MHSILLQIKNEYNNRYHFLCKNRYIIKVMDSSPIHDHKEIFGLKHITTKKTMERLRFLFIYILKFEIITANIPISFCRFILVNV